MVKAMAEQLAAAHAEIKQLWATLEERDNTISQLRQEVRELSETVGLQAQTLGEQEAALTTTVRGLAGGSQPDRRSEPNRLTSACGARVSAHLAGSRGRVGSVCAVRQAGTVYSE